MNAAGDLTHPFVPGVEVRIEGSTNGPLKGLSFAAKDLFDVAGVVTGGGNPDWAAQNPIPSEHAYLVERLLAAGAELIGKTVTDEVSLGILGDSAFFGTPTNPAAPDRVPGGSSSGSASAVASGACDIALGTDTGGSVRVPASFCGLFGIRPTHGRMNLRGMMQQAPTSDTAGWFARDAMTFAMASEVLLEEPLPSVLPSRLIVASDAFGIADADTRAALAPMLERLKELIGSADEETMALPGLSTWSRTQRTLQAYEAWQTFKDWIDADNPRFAFGIARSLTLASMTSETELQWAAMMRHDACARMDALLDADTILCMPTTPFPAPRKGLSISAQAPLRLRMSSLCSHGGLTGVCQVSIPGSSVDGAPVGLSVVGAKGCDANLVAVARALGERFGG